MAIAKVRYNTSLFRKIRQYGLHTGKSREGSRCFVRLSLCASDLAKLATERIARPSQDMLLSSADEKFET
jgi:hypothetical protein